ncbi:MAG TPA: cytochrome C oxidase subunit IV family protein [Candidatus Saccharimonadales bacterium]|jgi:cytochrome o ubiquinol oxidase operon protein cyoD|nr:cytochrome C oxidase subunit IV family protein [Candidatus Saccharimonadales bacterium]
MDRKFKLTLYVADFLFSILLTLIAYTLIVRGVLPGTYMMLVVAGLAIIQLLVQLLFFLRLGRGSKPHWNLLVLGFSLLMVIILVFGSLWTMNNVTPSQTDDYIVHGQGTQKP